MKKQKQTIKRLGFTRETIRSLSPTDLKAAIGAGEGVETDGTVVVCINTGCCMCGCGPKKY
jgi:hypothetical protein